MEERPRNARTDLKRRSREQRKHHLKRWLTLSGIMLLLLIALVIGFFQLPYFAISHVEVQGNTIVQTDDISRVVQEHLAGSYYWIFPKKNIFLYPKTEIEQALIGQFSRLDSVEVGFRDFRSILIVVNERAAEFLWCPSDSTVTDTCYFLDNTGTIFAEAPHFSGNVFLEIHGTIPDDPLGKKVIDPAELTMVANFVNKLPAIFSHSVLATAKVTQIEVGTQGDYTALMGQGDSTWELLFNKSESPDDLATNLTAVLTSDAFLKERTGKQLQYIDQRFGNKVFYKFR